MIFAVASGPVDFEKLIYGVLAVAAVVLIAISFFVVRGNASRPLLMIVSGFAGLLAGLIVGMLVMLFLQGGPSAADSGAPTTAPFREAGTGPEAGGGRRGGMGGMAAMGAMGGAGIQGGQRPPFAKMILATLVTKLDLLTGKPLTVDLKEDEKQKIREQIQGLQDLQELSGEEAEKRLQAIQDAVKDHRDLLEAVGYRWQTPGEAPQFGGGMGGMMGGPGMGGPGMGGGGRGRPGGMGGPGGGQGAMQPAANPFTDETNKRSLEALQDRVGKATKAEK